MNPLVSIITPTYNHERFIGDCIRSVLSQTFNDWEMIIVDDGSLDRTSGIIQQFTDPRIRYVRQEHLGAYKLGVTYNKALTMARGEFIAILEGDDYWPDYKLERQIPYFTAQGIILTYGECIESNENGKPIIHRTILVDKDIRENRPIGSALREFVKPQNFIYPRVVMIRKEVLLKIGGFVQPEYLPLVDFPTWCRLALEGEFKSIPQPLGFWRRHLRSVSFQESFSIRKGFVRYIQEFIVQYHAELKKLDLDFNLSELKVNHTNCLKVIVCGNGTNYLLLGANKEARKCFFLYLRSRHKNWHYSLISILGIVSSYLGINLVEPLAILKRKVVEFIKWCFKILGS